MMNCKEITKQGGAEGQRELNGSMEPRVRNQRCETKTVTALPQMDATGYLNGLVRLTAVSSLT